MTKVFAFADKVQQAYDDDVYQVFSYRQMKGVLLTKREALVIGMQLIAMAGVEESQGKNNNPCVTATSTSE